MKNKTVLKPLHDSILFEFVQEVRGGMFHETTASGLQIIESKDKQLKSSRWGKVVALGKDVSSEITVGVYILIEALMWTTHIELDGEKFWRTTEPKILALSDERPVIY